MPVITVAAAGGGAAAAVFLFLNRPTILRVTTCMENWEIQVF